MSNEKRLPKPESLEAKFLLLSRLPYDRRAKRKHCLVFGFVLDWYHDKYGDALASVRHVAATLKERDPNDVGLYLGDVHAALTDLVTWGYLHQTKGYGRKASRYIPAWDLVCVRENANTTDDEISVRENANTCVRENQNATDDSVHETPNEDPLTLTRSTDRDTKKEGVDCTAPMAPTLDGLAATAAETVQGGFAELWKAYFPKRGRGDKKKARRAYEAINPSATLHTQMVEAAGLWFDAWNAQGKETAARKNLDTWLTDEHYECDPPTAYQPKEPKTKPKKPAKAAPEASNDNVEPETIPDFLRGSPALWGDGVYIGEFDHADIETECDGAESFVRINFEGADGKTREHKFSILSSIRTAREDGERLISEINRALDLPYDESEIDEWLFKPIKATVYGSRITYSKAA